MRTLAFILPFVILACGARANNEKTVPSKVQAITLYPSSAQVSRDGTFQLQKGTTQLVFEEISPSIMIATIQASGKGDYVILDVKYRVKQPDPVIPDGKPIPPAIQQKIDRLADSLIQLKFELEYLQGQRDVLLMEKNVLLGNKYMKGQLDTITQLQFAMEYLRRQLDNINLALHGLKKDEFAMTTKRDAMQERLQALRAYNQHINPKEPEKPRHQIVVTVSAEAAVTGSLSLSYMVGQAGWTPMYDIRATSPGQPIQLVGKAQVYQHSGEEWRNVSLKLSTITPQQGYSKPALPPLYAGYFRPRPAPAYQLAETASRARRTVAGIALMEDYQKDSPTMASYTEENTTLTNIEYDISIPYTIPSDGQPHMVAVMDKKIPAEFYHYLVPRLDKQAYLVARIPGWNDLDLLPGPANIYFEGSYVGETRIVTGILGDTLELALGKDRSVIVERKKEKDDTRNALLGNNITRTIAYSIKVKNNKAVPLNLVIEDQIPISRSDEIKIKALEYIGAELAAGTGILTWKVKLASKEGKSLNFSYSIESDKSRPLANIY